MKRIETEYWKPHPDKPDCVVFDKGRPVRDVFEELQQRLESSGHLPDEYFLLDMDWRDGKEWPKDGYMYCTVDYGESEGIYLDIHLRYPDESGKYQTKSFATGKTLGETDEDMDRMYLIASAVTKAFHSDFIHERYVKVAGAESPKSDAAIQNTAQAKPSTEMNVNIYIRNGYKNRADYLECLSEEYDTDIEKIQALADMLGPNEDFDGLVTSLEDMSLEI